MSGVPGTRPVPPPAGGHPDGVNALPTAPLSMWLDVERAEPRAALADDVRCEVAVVGAGIAGLTTALLLARQGVDVRVLESRRVGDGCTGHTNAKCTVLHGSSFSQLRETHGADVTRRYAQANLAGLSWLADTAADADCAWETRSAVSWASGGSDAVDSMESEVRAARDAGVRGARLTADVGLPLDDVAAAVLLPDQGQVDPYRYLLHLAAELEAAGGRLHEHTRARSVSWRGLPTVLTADGPRVVADRVVVATQVPFLDRGLFFARLEPYRSYQLAVRLPDAPPEVMAISTGSPTRSYRDAPSPQGGRVALVGGDGHKTGQGPSTWTHVRDLAAWAERVLGSGSGDSTVVEHRWSAQDYESPDDLPYVGRLLPTDDRVLVVTGLRKWGMTNGTAAALALAPMARGEAPPSWATVYDPARVTLQESATSFISSNANVAKEMVLGWVTPDRGRHRELAEGEGEVVRNGLVKVGRSKIDGVERQVSAVCPHLGGILSWNDADRSWDCPLHGSRFAPDGTMLQGPAVGDLPCSTV